MEVVNKKLDNLIEQAQIAFIVTVDCIVVEANEYSQKHIGIKIGSDIRQYFDNSEQEDMFDMSELNGFARNVILRYCMAEGSPRYFLASFTAVEYGASTAYAQWAMDIEKDGIKYSHTRATQQSLQTVLDSLPMPIRIINLENAGISYVNNNFLELLGYNSADEVYGSYIGDLMPEFTSNGTDVSEIIDMIMLAEEPISFEIEYLNKTGGVTEAMEVSSIIDYKGIRSSIGIIKDLAAEKERAKILLNAMEREKDANQAKSMFLANMSHEIRTPMNGIIGFSELALDTGVTQEAKDDYLRKIKISGEGLLQIINDILDISKIESGNMVLENIPFNLHDLFSICQTIIAPKALEKGITLYCYAEPSVGKKLLGDPTRLRQVLLNLLSNAVKFTNSGIVKLMSIIKASTADSVSMCFEVKDSGIGMSQEQISRIFEPFTQADASITRNYGGTGLGLSIVKNIIELMGGKLTVESMPGLGSKFGFDLTFQLIDSPVDIENNEIVFNELEKPVFSGIVLICEDNQINQKVLQDHLIRVGLDSEIASNGQEGVDIVKRRIDNGEKPFDLIFMDIHMPVMDGLEAANKLYEIGNKTPIVALTANIMVTDKELYRKNHMPDYVAKPFTTRELWTCLYKYFTPMITKKVDRNEQSEAEEKRRKRLLTDFVRDNRSTFKDINDAINAGDIKVAHRIAHTLKGLAGMMGKTSLQEAAGIVENSLKNGKAEYTEEQMNTLEHELSTVLDELSPLMNEQEIPSADPPYFNKAEASELFAKLESLLESYDAECVELVEELKAIPETGALIRQIEQFEYDQALETLALIRNGFDRS